MKTQVNQQVNPTVSNQPTNGQAWESFPQPKGWSVNWDREGLIRVNPKPATK